jgi:hypothetical protein
MRRGPSEARSAGRRGARSALTDEPGPERRMGPHRGLTEAPAGPGTAGPGPTGPGMPWHEVHLPSRAARRARGAGEVPAGPALTTRRAPRRILPPRCEHPGPGRTGQGRRGSHPRRGRTSRLRRDPLAVGGPKARSLHPPAPIPRNEAPSTGRARSRGRRLSPWSTNQGWVPAQCQALALARGALGAARPLTAVPPGDTGIRRSRPGQALRLSTGNRTA